MKGKIRANLPRAEATQEKNYVLCDGRDSMKTDMSVLQANRAKGKIEY
ncbi:hypothetical protein GCM10020331_080640 [Ectobacillus funiculus]